MDNSCPNIGSFFALSIALAGSQLLKTPHGTTKSWFFYSLFSFIPASDSCWPLGGPLDSSAMSALGCHPPPWTPLQFYSSSPFHLASLLVDRALALIPAPFRPSHIQQNNPPKPSHQGASATISTFRTLTIETRGASSISRLSFQLYLQLSQQITQSLSSL